MSITNLIEESTTEITLAITQLDAANDAKEELIELVNRAMEAIITASKKKTIARATATKIKKAGTARSFFAAEVRARLKKEGKSGKEITSTISREWKAMKGKPERVKYVDLSKADKIRYNSQIAESGQAAVATAPRGVSHYVCFCRKHRAEVVAQGFKGRAATKKLSSMWEEFKSTDGVKDTDEWKELEAIKKQTDDEKLPVVVEVVGESKGEPEIEPKKNKKKKKTKKKVDEEHEEYKETDEEYQARMQMYDDETTGFLPQDLWDKEVAKGYASNPPVEESKEGEVYDPENPEIDYDNVAKPSTPTGKRIIDRFNRVRNSSIDDLSLEDEGYSENDEIRVDLKNDVFDDDDFACPIKSYDIEIKKMKKARLQDELRTLNIKTTGNLRDLKARLSEASGLDIGYAYDSLAKDSESYPTPAPDFAYGANLTIPTTKKDLRRMFKIHGFRFRNVFELVEVVRHNTACPRSILYRSEEIKKMKDYAIYFYDAEMRKKKRAFSK